MTLAGWWYTHVTNLTLAGTCQDFVVPDYRDAEVYAYQAVYDDGWDGTHVDIWFNAENSWRIRCGRVGGGELVLNNNPQLLECNFMQ